MLLLIQCSGPLCFGRAINKGNLYQLIDNSNLYLQPIFLPNQSIKVIFTTH